jgi:molybdopterin molybdotransferase
MEMVLEDALELLLQSAQPVETEAVLLGNCYRRILAEDIAADMDFPPFSRSPLDGYAVRWQDIQDVSPECPAILKEIENVPAGAWPVKTVEPATATRIMTGAKIPEGADAVVRIEDTLAAGGTVKIYRADGAKRNICRQGEEFVTGTTILSKGMELKEGALGLLATFGHSAPLVYCRPKVAILATGSEVTEVQNALVPGKIRDSNSYMLMGKVWEAGGQPILLGCERDDIGAIAERLSANADISLYITTGGASVGDYDLMEKVFKYLDIPVFFNKIAIKPGMPSIAGQKKGAFYVALSGNPAAAGVAFEVLVRPLLRRLAGAAEIFRPVTLGKLERGFGRTGNIRRFVWARLAMRETGIYVEPSFFQSNGMLLGMLSANALIDIPPGIQALEAGTVVAVRLLTDWKNLTGAGRCAEIGVPM